MNQLIRSIHYMTNKKNWRRTNYVPMTGMFDTKMFYEEVA